MAIIRRHSDTVEVAGLDEAYVDLTGELLPKTACRRIKHEIREETGLVCSIGLAPNKLLAKIASDLDKPDGFCVLREEEMLERVGDRPASLIPGVGPKTFERLRAAGIETVAQLARAPEDLLAHTLGPRLGLELQRKANGHDERCVHTSRERKSESCETTFAHDVADRAQLVETLDRLAARLCEGLERHRTRGRTVTLKIRLRPFRTYTRSLTLDAPTRDPAVVRATAHELLGRVELDAPVRLLGVGLHGLDREAPAEDGQLDDGQLFAHA
jgi:DNA polymerase-4